MTNEEKAKAYDEALEKAKELLDSPRTCFDIVQLKDIFPELSESEDERIRKAALEGIEYLERKLGWDAIGDTDILDVKEYLEKQKESLHISESCKENADSFTDEDERIRKWLVDYFSSIKETVWIHRDITCGQILAWLEKQKYNRMKPIYDARESFESALEKAWNDYHNGYENVDKLEDDYVECAHAKGFREGYLFGIEKQKEQKPNIEICPHFIKSKSYSETGYPIEDCDYGLEIALNILEKTLGKVQGFQTDDGIREHQTAIKAVKDAMKEQKPAEKQDYSGLNDLERAIHRGFLSAGVENVPVTIIKETAKECLAQIKPAVWKKATINGEPISTENQSVDIPLAKWSEEDEKIRKTLLDYYEEALDNYTCVEWLNGITYGELCDWLKSLRPQPKQEWSEEDENKLNHILEIVHIASGSEASVNEKEELESFLKSLRPSWKPSDQDELMKLKYAGTSTKLD